MLWFEYKKETNIFCVATFSVALTIQENYFRIQD